MKLLFIGNSHTYVNSVPAIVRTLLEETGTRTHVTMLAQGGKTLAFHAEKKDTLFNIRHGEYDVMIAQDRASVFDKTLFFEGAAALKKQADAVGTATLLYMPWALRDNRALQGEMTDAYLGFARENGVPVAAAGETFGRLLQHYPAELLYHPDGNHATFAGSYVAALTIFYTLTGRKRTVALDKINDPGIEAGLDPELCRQCHAEACFTARLYNA